MFFVYLESIRFKVLFFFVGLFGELIIIILLMMYKIVKKCLKYNW